MPTNERSGEKVFEFTVAEGLSKSLPRLQSGRTLLSQITQVNGR